MIARIKSCQGVALERDGGEYRAISRLTSDGNAWVVLGAALTAGLAVIAWQAPESVRLPNNVEPEEMASIALDQRRSRLRSIALYLGFMTLAVCLFAGIFWLTGLALSNS